MGEHEPKSSQGSRHQRRRFYSPEIQRKYGRVVGPIIFFYSVLLFGVAMLVPLVTRAVRMSLPGASVYASREFIIVVEAMWPMPVGLVIAALLLAVFVTGRSGGQLYRIEQSAAEWANGNLALRMRFRSYDRLDQLAARFNEAWSAVDSAMLVARTRGQEAHDALSRLAQQVRDGSPVDEQVVERIEEALEASRRVVDVTKPFILTEPGNESRSPDSALVRNR